jgi:hypothetical protein
MREKEDKTGILANPAMLNRSLTSVNALNPNAGHPGPFASSWGFEIKDKPNQTNAFKYATKKRNPL